MFISGNVITKDTVMAIQIAAYVKPEFRNGCGRWMLAKVDRDLHLDVDKIYRHERPLSQVGLVYKSLGYAKDETTYVLDT